jgi:hypothetical protein
MLSFWRWLPTFVGFPVGGLLAVETVGAAGNLGEGLAAGALAGLAIGLAQAWALGRWQWAVATAVGCSIGIGVGIAITGGETSSADLVGLGAVTGLFVGLAQAPLLDAVNGAIARVWPAILSAGWALGWLTTSSIGVDVERGYVAFGSSGAIVVTVITGLALRSMKGSRVGVTS